LVSGPREGSGLPSCSLFFDPQLTEGEWEAGHPGGMIGATECLVAAIVREILVATDDPQLGRAIQGGVAAGRRLHLDGYEELGSGRLALGFPLGSVADEIAAGRTPLDEVAVPDPAGAADGRAWTILADRYPANLVELARDAALIGPMEALPGVPLGRFGRLVTADRSEIEAYRSIRSLIAEYCAAPAPKPLSIGVFGPPGSGKSFGIVQVSRSVARSVVGEPLEFNLSQFQSPDELVDAFHLVRDEALTGSVPLVFWDEFDTPLEGRPLGWLRFFLAPMQDGAFREGQVTHPLGRCIFVFAGGTCQRAQDFGADMDARRFREAKGPDFVSRLRGYVDVLGPNPQGGDDPHHVIRRAILLRSILRMRAPALFDGDSLRIDPGVLRAFLETRQFRHGARSLESIVAMSRLSGMAGYERSSLPPESQLDLHVDSADFLALVQRLELQGDLLERLAEAAHEVYCEGLRARGYRWGPEPDDEGMISDSMVPYAELTELKKDQNRGTVRDIPDKLQRVGCVMVPARREIPRFAFTAEEVDLLAREEHERWMAGLGGGWRHGERTDRALKVHEAYRPWGELPESQRVKDRDLVRDLPEIVARAGYAVVRGGRPAEESA
ncbi:MAG: RyR domain-containing protein, partial [Actinomycetota bacterium]